MDRHRDYHTKVSKSEIERQTSYDITYMWNVNYVTNELIDKTNKLTSTENRLVVDKGEEEKARDEMGIWD